MDNTLSDTNLSRLNEIRTALRPNLILQFRNQIRNMPDDKDWEVISRIFFDEFNTYLDEERNLTDNEMFISHLLELFTAPIWISKEDDGMVKALFPLYYSPGGYFFIHGPDSVLHAAILAHQLLDEGDSIIEITEVEWPRLAFEKLEVGVRSRSGNKYYGFPPYDQCHLLGSFLSKKNRVIDFYAIAKENELVSDYKSFNPLIIKTIFPINRTRRAQNNSLKYSLNPVTDESNYTALQANALAVHSVLEIIGTLLPQPWMKYVGKELKFLSRKIKRVPVPSLQTLQSGGSFEIKYFLEDIKDCRKQDFFKIPYQCSFSFSPDFISEGGMAFTELSLSELLRLIL